MISLIAASGLDRAIGANNKLLWNLPNDLKYFKEKTIGRTIIMGRKTFDSLPFKLPYRKHIVITRSKIESNDPDITYVNNIEDIISKYKDCSEEVFVIGGAEIYSQLFNHANKIYMTLVYEKFKNADAFFPDIQFSEFYILFQSRVYKKDKMNEYSHQMYEFVRM